MEILAHRGLEPSRRNFYSESSYEAFRDHLKRGFGVEFDPNFMRDGIVIAHDSTLERITLGRDKRSFSDLCVEEVLNVSLQNGRFCTFDELMDLIRASSSEVNALHFKGKYQNQANIDKLLEHLGRNSDLLERLIIFDVRAETARYLKERNARLVLAPSVADPYDIYRYNSYIYQTLMSVEEVIQQRELFDWVWMDEWDRNGKEGTDKKFYTAYNFERLKEEGIRIALVTPELHATSPSLPAGESHQDALNEKILFDRVKEIIELGPDAICTDYPEEILVKVI
ncbi:MAG TPA: glycerophosphodiester phosphodiesterase family protein [Patescibacteria group bacterium]